MRTLVKIFRHTGNWKYLKPIPEALAYLRRSLLPGGKLARFYELESNRPLYVKRRGKIYSLTHDDSDLPGHYSFKVTPELGQIAASYQRAAAGVPEPEETAELPTLAKRAQSAIEALDEDGRWLSRNPGKLRQFGDRVINSEVLSSRVETLCQYLDAAP